MVPTSSSAVPRVLATLAVAAALTGCGRSANVGPEPQAPPFPGTLVAGVCTGSLTDYCAPTGGPCPAYEAAVARRRSHCTQPGTWVVVERHCVGQFRAVSWRESVLGGGEEYFGGEGQLVAARLSTDYPAYCDFRSFTQAFGSVPACAEEMIVTPLCDP